MTLGLQLGRPGIYRQDVRAPVPIEAVRLDVAGFVGVALRGPVDRPTAVVSWADFERRFGGLGPNVSGRDRLLPYAVQAFFAQGGVRAWIVRVTATDGPGVPTRAAATARFAVPGSGAEIVAADEGRWGGELSIRWEFAVAATFATRFAAPDRVQLPGAVPLPPDSLLRIRRRDVPRGELRRAAEWTEPRTGVRLALLDTELPVDDAGAPRATEATVEVITGTLVVADPAGSGERIERLGLLPEHPRFPPKVLAAESLLVRTGAGWTEPITPDLLLTGLDCPRTQTGRDRSDAVDTASFFDPGEAGDDPLDSLSDPADELAGHHGVDAVGRVGEVGIVCVPDLTWRALPVPEQPDQPARPPAPSGPRPSRARCPWDGEADRIPDPVVVQPDRSWLDGRDPVDFAEIVGRQRRTVAVAELRRRFVALLDVPTGLPLARITDWRAEFDSTYAGAFHPWLGVPRMSDPVGRRGSLLVPPSAFAAGIMAERERRLGLSRGPANQLALGAVRAATRVSDAEADRLHLQSVNLFTAERDGFRLIAARTLSSDSDYRQLSVRRLMTMLRLTLDRHGQALVFEPNTTALRTRLTSSLTQLLRRLHRQGAFSGATEEESFFVHCDSSTNPPDAQALGRLTAEIGVAPATPLEYLVLRISSDGDGGLVVAEAGRSAGPAAGDLVGAVAGG